jgi:hypothetical protein
MRFGYINLRWQLEVQKGDQFLYISIWLLHMHMVVDVP